MRPALFPLFMPRLGQMARVNSRHNNFAPQQDRFARLNMRQFVGIFRCLPPSSGVERVRKVLINQSRVILNDTNAAHPRCCVHRRYPAKHVMILPAVAFEPGGQNLFVPKCFFINFAAEFFRLPGKSRILFFKLTKKFLRAPGVKRSVILRQTFGMFQCFSRI